MVSLIIGARSSPLSKAQTREIEQLMLSHHPHLRFSYRFVTTHGDCDRTTSLRSLDKTDFFTREVDELILSGECRIAIHSAKDLPDPLPKGITMVALTRGVDPSDSLVFRAGENISSLRSGSPIATSSQRREDVVKQLRSDLSFVDIRGTIEERLHKLDSGEVDGVVIAEAALIRLGLTHRNRLKLPGETVPYQGQLAVMARENDGEMTKLFSCIDVRKRS